MRLKHKVAIVLGSARGIGQAVAFHFAHERATIIVDYAGTPNVPSETDKMIAGCAGSALAEVTNCQQNPIWRTP